jgi:hypothetical protein
MRPLALVALNIKESGDAFVAEFTREVDDAALDRALGALREAGCAVISVDAERATLLDVLERYERGDDAEGAAAAAQGSGGGKGARA